jgi:ABC-type sugar transport system ATPase subunit
VSELRPSEPLIQFRSVRKAFGDQTVLDGVDLTIERGGVTTIIGRSGVGKSVLLKHVVGLLEPDGGAIFYRGEDLLTLSRPARRALKSKISYMFQNMALFDSMTVFENIALPLEEKTRLPKAEFDGGCLSASCNWIWATSRTSIRRSSRGECASAWLWRAPSSRAPKSSCSTNPRPDWTRSAKIRFST